MSKENYTQVIEKAFNYYYEKSHEYRGDWPDTIKEFINKCKTDSEFSERWGLKIEERELSLLERYELMKKLDDWISVHYKEPKTMEYMDKHNIPTKLITLTHKNEKIESYE